MKGYNQKKQELWKDSFVISLMLSFLDSIKLYVVNIHGPVDKCIIVVLLPNKDKS